MIPLNHPNTNKNYGILPFIDGIRIQKSVLSGIITWSVYETRWNSMLGFGSIVSRRRRCIRLGLKTQSRIGSYVISHSDWLRSPS